MNEPWISSKILIGFIGLISVVILEPLPNLLLKNEKVKKGYNSVVMTIGFVLAVILFGFGIIAYLYGQPGNVWFMSLFFGLGLMVGSGIVRWLNQKSHLDSEHRKSMLED